MSLVEYGMPVLTRPVNGWSSSQAIALELVGDPSLVMEMLSSADVGLEGTDEAGCTLVLFTTVSKLVAALASWLLDMASDCLN